MRYHTVPSLLLGALFLVASSVQALDGDLDPTFLSDVEYPGYSINLGVYSGINTINSPIKVLKTQNGGLYIVGRSDDEQANKYLTIIKLYSNGQRDDTFNDYGIQAYLMPCNATDPSDADIDQLGRVWIAFRGSSCGEGRIYRYTAAGNLDLSLLGSGYLNVNFPGDLSASSLRIKTMPDNGIIAAASFTGNGQNPQLGVARFDSNGTLVGNFAPQGLMSLPGIMTNIHHIHQMGDGRIVIDGRGGSNDFAIIVRLLSNGQIDASFGNSGPGVSSASLSALIGFNQYPEIRDSILLRDGSIVQIGSQVRPGTVDNYDFMIMKWRPDGYPDTNVSPSGNRSYALDFGGFNPNDTNLNNDRAYSATLQSDGKLLLAGSVLINYGTYSRALTFIRLNRDLSVDGSFGQNGKLKHFLNIGNTDFEIHDMLPINIFSAPGRIFVGAKTLNGYFYHQTVLALQNDLAESSSKCNTGLLN